MKKTGKRIIGIVVLLLIVVLLQGSMVSTYNDEYKLVLQFGKVVRVVETPGLSFKIPFLQTTQSIPNYEMIYDLIPSEVNTRDKKVMVTDSFALWSVTDPLAYLSRLGANKANAESRISVVVYNAVKNVISSTDQGKKGGDKAFRPPGFQQGGRLPAYDLRTPEYRCRIYRRR